MDLMLTMTTTMRPMKNNDERENVSFIYNPESDVKEGLVLGGSRSQMNARRSWECREQAQQVHVCDPNQGAGPTIGLDLLLARFDSLS
jgi:hypothetical protein